MLMSLIPFNAKRSRCGVLGADTTADAFLKRSKHPKQMAFSKQASSIFVDTIPRFFFFFQTALIWDICNYNT